MGGPGSGRRRTVNYKSMTPEQKRQYHRDKQLHWRSGRRELVYQSVAPVCMICDATDNLMLDLARPTCIICSRCSTAIRMMDGQPALLRQAADYLERVS